MNNIIYLDNAATTKVDKEVLETYNKVSTTFFANTSSIHSLGYKNNDLLEKARASILSNLNLKDDELIFTSGATESNNLAIKGYALKHKNRGNHIIVSSIEHPSVLECAKQLESEFGFNVTYLPVKEDGKIDINTLKEAIRKETILVSIMSVNNETGVIEPIEEIASLLKGYNNIAFHVDAVQSIGKVDINLKDVDLITLTSHKIILHILPVLLRSSEQLPDSTYRESVCLQQWHVPKDTQCTSFRRKSRGKQSLLRHDVDQVLRKGPDDK